MQAAAWAEWEASFIAFHARLADLFVRAESRQQAAKYLRGLLSPVERKNGWQVAEALGDATPDRMQRLLYRVDWDVEAARDRVQQFVIERFGDPEGIGVVDETGFVKKGTASVGVQRQYSGTAGKVENCQVATLLSYTSARGHAFLDRQLYLPAGWAEDPARRARAKVPPEVRFQTKPQQAQVMLERAWAQGVPMRWVTGDEVYGDAPALRAAVATSGRWYVLAVSCTCPVWTRWPAVVAPQRHTGGRPQTHARRAPEAPASQTVAAVAAAWPAARWQRHAVAPGEKGPRVYDWAVGRVVESVQGLPARESWLLARRSVSDPSELAYSLSNAPAGTPWRTLAGVAAQRYTVEQCIEEAKGEAGLDHYEVRHWPSWYRHVTLALLAHAWLAAMRAQAPVDPAERAVGGALPASWHP
jgi:SRSO17 transposase